MLILMRMALSPLPNRSYEDVADILFYYLTASIVINSKLSESFEASTDNE